MKKFNVGIQLYGLRNTLAEDFFGTLKAVRDMGYEYVEFAGYYGKTSEEIKAILDKYNLKCISVHQRLEFFNEDPQGAVDFLKGFGVEFVVVPWMETTNLAGYPEWENTKKDFVEKADLFAKNGMMLGYHNHDFEFAIVNGKYVHDYIFEAVAEDKIVPEIDTCWVRYADLDPAAKIRQFKGRVPIVHLKDFVCKNFGGAPVYDLIGTSGEAAKTASKEDNGFEFRPLGDGLQDFKSILEACEECGTHTVIVEQDKTYGGMSELEAAKRARDYLKNTFGI